MFHLRKHGVTIKITYTLFKILLNERSSILSHLFIQSYICVGVDSKTYIIFGYNLIAFFCSKYFSFGPWEHL